MMARATKRYAQSTTGHWTCRFGKHTLQTSVLKEDVIPEAPTVHHKPEWEEEYDHDTSMETLDDGHDWNQYREFITRMIKR